jgi:hypothetical protein
MSISKKYKFPIVFAAHIRWCIVLAKLKELDLDYKIQQTREAFAIKPKDKKLKTTLESLEKDQKSKLSVNDLVKTLGLESISDQSPEGNLSRTDWDQWFCGKDKSTPLNSIYQCKGFYALEAPNNLVQRLTNMCEEFIKPEFDESKDRVSKYDTYINDWGEYALKLVNYNGGLANFLSLEHLSEVKDFWTEEKTPTGENFAEYAKDKPLMDENFAEYADHPNSLIKRILFLESDRYIQILTSTVAMLWPLWFFKRHENVQILKDISQFEKDNKNLNLGKPLPESEIFIDINTYIGEMAGLPYPFGIADKLLAINPVGRDGTKYQTGDPWPSEAQALIAEKIKQEFWSPPLLLAVRSGQFDPNIGNIQIEQRINSNQNNVVPLIKITDSCKDFYTIHVRKDLNHQKKSSWQDKLTKLKFAVEAGTFGDRLVKKLQKILRKYGQTIYSLPISRIQSSSDFAKPEFSEINTVPSYSPVNILIQTNPDYRRMTELETYQYEECASVFSRSFPAIVLCGGIFLARQPKAVDLIVDTAIYLNKLDILFRQLRPQWKVIEEEFEYLQLDDIDRKVAAVKTISKDCFASALSSPLVQMKIIFLKTEERAEPDNPKILREVTISPIEQWLVDIGKDMGRVLHNHEPELQEKFNTHWQQWGWATLFEFDQYVSISISCDLF